MSLLLNTATSIFKVNLQAKLINTLFALTLATYYISSHHAPILYRWNFKNKICEALNELRIESPSETLSPEIRAALYRHNLLSSSTLEPLITFSINPRLKEHNDFIGRKLNVAERFINNALYNFSLPAEAGTKALDVMAHLKTIPLSNDFSGLLWRSFASLRNEEKGGESTSTVIGSKAKQSIKSEKIIQNGHVPRVSPLPPLSSKTHSALPKELPTPPSFVTSQSSPQESLREQVTPDLIATSFSSASKNVESLSVKPQQPFEPNPKSEPRLFESTQKNSLRSSTAFKLKPWHTYKKTSNNPLFIFWLMKVAPESPVPEEEIPFRKAFVKTMLSPEFQPFINGSWEGEDEEDEEGQEDADASDIKKKRTAFYKKKRADFFYAYMKNVKWPKTPFGFLFPPEVEVEDWHHVKEDTFLAGYEFPLRFRGVHPYKDEDFCSE